MLIVASAVLADDRAAGRPGRLSARVSFTIGVVASIIANVLAAPDNIVARFISAWPARALLLVVEMLTGGAPAPRCCRLLLPVRQDAETTVPAAAVTSPA